MKTMKMAALAHVMAFWLVASFLCTQGEAQGAGVNYGFLGDNLPPPEKVVALMKSANISKVRIFNANHTVLAALQGSGIQVILGTLNQELQILANDPAAAAGWVHDNVIAFSSNLTFRFISAGNEVIPGNLAAYVLPAMQNLDAALRAANLSIPVTTTVATSVLGVSYPPSQGTFSEAAAPVMAQIAGYLQSKSVPLLVNVYPYFAYADNQNEIKLDYALFNSSGIVVQDGSLGYRSLFDAMVDSVYSALEKAGGPGVEIVVTETGWPSAAGFSTTAENAQTYNNNVLAHAKAGGTPKRPGKQMEVYLFALFNEDLKPAGVEQNWGLYWPDMTEIYHVDFKF